MSMVARLEVREEGRASRFKIWSWFLSSSLLTASFSRDRHVGIVSDSMVCLPALNFDSLDYATGGSGLVRRWPSLASCCRGCPPVAGRAGDFALPCGRFLPHAGRTPTSQQRQPTSTSISSSVRVQSRSDVSKQFQVIYLHIWKQIINAGSGYFYDDLCDARRGGDKACGLYEDAVVFLVRHFVATVVMDQSSEAVGLIIQRNVFEADFASFQRSKYLYASKQLLLIMQSSTAIISATTLEILGFLWCVFDQILETGSIRKNISKYCKQTLVLLQHHSWCCPCACRPVSIRSSS